jgi:hypothetical protein
MNMRSVSVSLRRWFVVHFVADVVIAVPLLAAPAAFLNGLGWGAVDPIAARMVGAVEMIEPPLGHEHDVGQIEEWRHPDAEDFVRRSSGPRERSSTSIASGYAGGRCFAKATAMCLPRSTSSSFCRPAQASLTKAPSGKAG